MKHLILIALFFQLKAGIGQIVSFDRGQGRTEDLNIAVTALKFITQNKPGDLQQFFAKEYKPDMSSLQQNCSKIATDFPFTEGSYAPCFCKNREKSLWYERTYFKQTGGKTEYLLQIFIKLNWKNGQVKITDIQFREKDKIIPRPEEVEEMLKPVDKDTPPPPPPPFGLDGQ